MGQVLIRNLDDGLLTDYRRAASDKGRSLEAELRDALARARPVTRLTSEDLIALSHRLWAATPDAAAATDSTPFIRATRDRR